MVNHEAIAVMVVVGALILVINVIKSASTDNDKSKQSKGDADQTPAPASAPVAMLESDMPPALMLLENSDDEPVLACNAAHEHRVTSNGFKWFRPVVDLDQFINKEPLALQANAVTPTGAQRVVDFMLRCMQVNYGYGPQGRVVMKPQAQREPMAIRGKKKDIRAIQLVRRSLFPA